MFLFHSNCGNRRWKFIEITEVSMKYRKMLYLVDIMFVQFILNYLTREMSSNIPHLTSIDIWAHCYSATNAGSRHVIGLHIWIKLFPQISGIICKNDYSYIEICWYTLAFFPTNLVTSKMVRGARGTPPSRLPLTTIYSGSHYR